MISKKQMIKEGAGFTLIELIMVITIAGILAVIAIPRFESFYAVKLDGATKKTVSDIRYIQHFAISRHADSRIEFNAPADSYQGCYCNEADGDCTTGGCGSANWSFIPDPFTRTDLDVDFTTDSEYRGINIQSPNFGGGSILEFNWQGIPQSGGSLVLNYQGGNRTILVEPNTGNVSVQ